MSLTKLSITPDQASYVAQDGADVDVIQLSGGAARYRLDVLKGTSLVTVQWTASAVQFKYIRAFYNSITKRGSLPFLIDLILDEVTLTEHTAHFVPSSMKHSPISGLNYTISAQLEVSRNDDNDDANESYVILVNSFGFDDDSVLAGLLSLEQLVNTSMPDAVPA